eukprot:TRINITY_DN61809_c0_g1_i1.p1 TRINITY_DN61809_c0_g1~~TRINITY_DN61809_c0_g1_i1.p1  ORF type:complete len:619 (-),score=84.55 TRINITY_DN61809_c0_g1_i1:356-2212(-)
MVVLSQKTDVAAQPARGLKRPAPSQSWQRRHVFKRRLHVSFEDRMHAFLGRHAGTDMVRVAIGRVIGKGTQRDIVMPIANPAIFEGDSHDFVPSLTQTAFDAIKARMDAQLASWQTSPVSARRWFDFRVDEVSTSAPPACAEALTVFCPEGLWHYQVRAGAAATSLPQAANEATAGCVAGDGEDRREVRYYLQKSSGVDGLCWQVSLSSTSSGARSVELVIGSKFLWEQHTRMLNRQAHAFGNVARSLIENSRSMVRLLCELDGSGSGVDGAPIRRPPVYYPGLFEPSDAVRVHYDKKVYQARANTTVARVECLASENVRKYNNLIKVLLIEHFVDTLPSPVRVLDIGCGKGQDVQKYSRSFRSALVEKYVGIDFAETAIAEARRRHEYLLTRAGPKGEYEATFYAADVRVDGTFERLVSDGHEQFDVITAQFALSYLAESERVISSLLGSLARLLRPGGHLIGCLPSSFALADLYASAVDAGSTGKDVSLGNSLYRIEFDQAVVDSLPADADEISDVFAQRWGLPYRFSLTGAVDSQQEYAVPWEAFEELAGNIGFITVADAGFGDLLSAYSKDSSFFKGQFGGDQAASLTEEEEQLFNFYSGFVMKRLDDSDAKAR